MKKQVKKSINSNILSMKNIALKDFLKKVHFVPEWFYEKNGCIS